MLDEFRARRKVGFLMRIIIKIIKNISKYIKECMYPIFPKNSAYKQLAGLGTPAKRLK